MYTRPLHAYRVAQGVASDQRNPIVDEHAAAMKERKAA